MSTSPFASANDLGRRLLERRSESVGVAVLLAGLAVWYAVSIDGAYFVDEAMYAQTAAAMLEGNPYENPTHIFAPTGKYFIALGRLLFGWTGVGARLPILGFGLATVYATYRLGRLLDGGWTGLFAASALGVSFPFVHRSVMVMLDVPLAFFVLATVYFTVGWFREGGSWRAVAAGSAGALAVTTKAYGFFYAAAPLAVVAAVALRRHGLRDGLTRIRPHVAGGLGTLALVYLPFLFVPHPPVPAEYARAAPFVETVLAIPVIGNFAYVFGAGLLQNVVHTGNGHAVEIAGRVYQYPPFWAYGHWLVTRGGPLYAAAYLLAVGEAAYRAVGRRDAGALAFGAALVVPVLALSLLTVKFPRYILPLYPLALAGGFGALVVLARAARGRTSALAGPRGTLLVVVLVVAGLGVASPAGVAQPGAEEIRSDTKYDEVADRIEAYAEAHPGEQVTVLAYTGSIRIAVEHYVDHERVAFVNFEANEPIGDARYAEARERVRSGEIDLVVGLRHQPRISDSFQGFVREEGTETFTATQRPDGDTVVVYRVGES